MQVNRAMGALWQELGRAPTVADLAARTDLSHEEVLQALEASRAYTSASLDEPIGDSGAVAADHIGGHDERYEISEEWLAMAPKLRLLSERERRILYLRFFQDMTQTEIAEEIGISQMHVSRLLTRSLERLREQS